MKKIYLLAILTITLAFNSTKAQDLSILLVNDNGWSPDRVEVIKQAITDAGYSYGYWDAPQRQEGPSFEFMQVFDLVIWYAGDDGASLYFWNGNETDNQNIMDYIDNGGMMWIQGLDILYDRYPTTPTPFLPGEFVYDYMGINFYQGQSKIDDDTWEGVPQLDVVAGNGIFTVDPITWSYDDQNMWYVDALEAINTNQHLYQMGPTEYPLSDYYSVLLHEKNDAKIMTFAFETARMDLDNNVTLQVFTQGLQYFEQFAEPGIAVEDINLTTEGGATSIEEEMGTLQVFAEVLPNNASIPFVQWSVVSEGVDATITQDGLLQASGSNNGNGSVWVKATAMDGTGISDSIQINISGQGLDFTVLLVNDCANSNSGGLTRHLEIDTTLTNLEITHNIYNTAVTGDYPDLYTLDGYDAIIWYTGNDGAGLKLWDVSDTAGAPNQNLRFNEPLMDYINNGGVVWLQGLDFIYDVYGTAWDAFEPGDFMYDFMGISMYAAQSHADGDDLPQLDVVPDNPICTFTPIEWVYEDGLWYADALDITNEAIGIYKMGPTSYVYSDFYAGVYTQPGDGHLFTLTVETARIDTEENTDAFFADVLDYLESVAPQRINNNISRNFKLLQNVPNPVSDFTQIRWSQNVNANVQISVFDINGRKVYNQDLGVHNSGEQNFDFSVEEANLSNGLYLYTLEINNECLSDRIIVAR